MENQTEVYMHDGICTMAIIPCYNMTFQIYGNILIKVTKRNRDLMDVFPSDGTNYLSELRIIKNDPCYEAFNTLFDTLMIEAINGNISRKHFKSKNEFIYINEKDPLSAGLKIRKCDEEYYLYLTKPIAQNIEPISIMVEIDSKDYDQDNQIHKAFKQLLNDLGKMQGSVEEHTGYQLKRIPTKNI